MFKHIAQLFDQLFRDTPTKSVTMASSFSMDDWFAQWEREREQRRQERIARRERAKARDRTTFGEETWGVSAQHRAAKTDRSRLARYDLPVLQNEAELATWLGITRERLRWFTHDRPADPVWHYVRHTQPKRSGGTRVILAPKRELKALQRRVLHNLLDRVPPTEAAHGFRPAHSISTNARPHVGQQIMLNLDLQDFFPTITYPRVRGIFISLGYSYSVASTLALLCTEHDRVAYERDDRCYYISVTPRALPQGAPTSPALANLVAARLDRRLIGLARVAGWSYTRYADDLTFSGDDRQALGRLLTMIKRIITEEHFTVHPKKVRVTHHSQRQIVTGLVVNDTVSTPRQLRRQLRAILHNAAQTGLEGQNHENHPEFRAYLAGMIGHVMATNVAQGRQLQEALQKVLD